MIGRFPLNLLDPIQYVAGFTKPIGIAYDATGDRIAVVNNSNNVTILDGASLSTITTITLPSFGTNAWNVIYYDSGNNRFLVEEDTSGTIQAISGVGYSVTTYITSLGTGTPTCRGIVISDTRIFFSCYFTGTTTSTVFVYNLSAATLITSFSVSSACGIVIDSSKIYVSCHGENNVKVYDLTSYALLSTITVGADAFSLTNDSSSDYIIIESRDSNSLKLLKKSTGTVVGGFAGTPVVTAGIIRSGKIYLTLPTTLNKIAIMDKFYS